ITGNYLMASILLLALGNAMADDVLEGTYNVTQVCTLVPTTTKLGSISSCTDYYTCTSSGPVKSSCASGYYYNYQTQQCAPQSQVNCFYGLDNPCAGQTTACWVPNEANCNAWYYCENETIGGHGYCPSGQWFNGAKGGCDYGSCTNSDSSSTGPVLTSVCQVVPPGIYFGTATNCSAWQLCTTTSSTPTTGNCATSVSNAFIVQTGSCGYKTEAGACDRIVSESPATGESCDGTEATKGDSSVCGTYYTCVNKVWVTQTCSSGQYYSTATEKCADRSVAVTTEGCNRCQDFNKMFANAAMPSNCSAYYYCNDYKQGTLSYCKYPAYFDENEQVCLDDPEQLPTYASSSGACPDGGSTSTGTTDANTGTTASG
ncbi:hypothetical protein KR222_000344, partial [Zaprionus bogoriensis]